MKLNKLLLIAISAVFSISSNAQNVGIGTTTPVNKLHVVDFLISGSTIYASKPSTFNGGQAILGENSSTQANAIGVQGTMTSTSSGSQTAGVYGLNRGTANGAGVLGRHNGTGVGVHGISNSGTAVFGFTVSGTAGRFVNAGGGLGLSVEGALNFRGIGEGTSKVLSSDALGNATWKNAIDIGWINGSGPANTVPKWGANGTTLVNSRISETNLFGPAISLNARTSIVGNLNVSAFASFAGGMSVETSVLPYVASFVNNSPGGNGDGIIIQVNDNTPDNNNDFINFRAENGNTVGRIEGQTRNELENSFDFVWTTTVHALDEAFIIAEGVACGIQADFVELGIMIGQGAAMFGEYGAWADNQISNRGVAYESGNGDYAEWLLKANPSEKFSYGDIVGVVGGKISKDLTNASHFMVISKAPIVLGNMPEAGKAELYEKVAFMGQVPIKIRGTANVGDYIIASEMNDGFGLAVNPKEITLDQVPRITGVAWSASKGGAGFSYVNGAIGINVNDVAPKVKQIEAENETLKATVNGLIAYLKEKDPSFKVPILTTNSTLITKEVKPLADTKAFVAAMKTPHETMMKNILDMLEKNTEMIESIQSHAKALLDKRGVKYHLFEQTNKLVTDSKYLISYLKEAGNVK